MDFAGTTFAAMGLVITDIGTHASENTTPSSAANIKIDLGLGASASR
jgi:hypothetical protein